MKNSINQLGTMPDLNRLRSMMLLDPRETLPAKVAVKKRMGIGYFCHVRLLCVALWLQLALSSQVVSVSSR